MKKIVITIDPDGKVKSETYGYLTPDCLEASKEILDKLVDMSKVRVDMKDTSVHELDDERINRSVQNG